MSESVDDHIRVANTEFCFAIPDDNPFGIQFNSQPPNRRCCLAEEVGTIRVYRSHD